MRARANPAGTGNEYEVDRCVRVLEILRDTSGWAAPLAGVHQNGARGRDRRQQHTRFETMTLRNGAPEKTNFESYRMIRMREAPKAIDAHVVKRDVVRG